MTHEELILKIKNQSYKFFTDKEKFHQDILQTYQTTNIPYESEMFNHFYEKNCPYGHYVILNEYLEYAKRYV